MRNFSTRFAGIEIGWPVAGFRPMRAFRSTITSFPTPGMVKPLRASLYASEASSSRNCPTCFLVRPVFSDSRFMVSDFEIPATYPSRAAYGLVGSRRILHERTRAHDATVGLQVVDEPPDRPAWVGEAVRVVLQTTRKERQQLLDRVTKATAEELAAGTDERWGLGQIAVHLLIVERGSLLISLRLAQGTDGGPTGQPRPAASGVSRGGIASPGG